MSTYRTDDSEPMASDNAARATGNLIDDRPMPGAAGDLIRGLTIAAK